MGVWCKANRLLKKNPNNVVKSVKHLARVELQIAASLEEIFSLLPFHVDQPAGIHCSEN
jgi:hypothetical protein